MPILVETTTTTVADGRSIRISGLPDFNAGDPAFKINIFEGWFDTSVPDVVLVANGGGAGAAAVGDWEPMEHYYTLVGRIDTGDQAGLSVFARLLKAGLPADQEVSLVCLGNGRDEDLQIFVRRYDKASLPIGQRLDFTFPLVAPDPYKYALEPLTGEMGVFTGQSWFRTYDAAAGPELLTANQTSGTDASSSTTGFLSVNPAATLSSSLDRAHGGPRSLKAACVALSDMGQFVELSPVIPVTAGERYEFTVQAGSDVASFGAELMVHWRDASTSVTEIATSSVIVLPSDGTWGEVRVAAVAPPGTIDAVLQVRRNQPGAPAFTGSVYVDTLSFHTQAAPYRTYTAGARTYEQAIPSGPYPPSLTLASDGDAASPRVVFTINGPVTAGDWWILNETTGRRLWVDVSVTAGQSLVLDCQAHTARLNGAPVDHLVFGDWIRLVPGPNTYRLVSGTASDAFASVEALPAYQ